MRMRAAAPTSSSAMHATIPPVSPTIMARLVAEEGESARLQKLNDALEAKLIEANENAIRLVRRAETNVTSATRAENQALRAEIRRSAPPADRGQRAARDDLADLTNLRSRTERARNPKGTCSKRSCGRVERTDSPAPTARRDAARCRRPRAGRRAGQMRRQIADLQATVERLKQYESIYLAAKARGQEPGRGCPASRSKAARSCRNSIPRNRRGHA